MIDKFQQQLEKVTALHQNRRRWLAILAVMAALVAAATAYALVRPAITLENPTYCGREEHAHTAACYTGIATGETAATPETAACGKEEHTHTLACYADPSADVEDTALWAQSVAQAELTGDWPHDAAAVAQTQLGYAASEKNYTVDADGETKHPYTRYGAWGGNAYADWNLPFVNFCLQYAGVPAEAFPQADTLAALLQWLADDPARYAVADGYTPQPGDVALLAENGTDLSAVGIVAELCPATDDEAAKVAVIEADASGTVRRVEYAQGDAQLMGYAILPQNPDYTPATAETAEPEATATPEPEATATPAPEFDEQTTETDEPATIADDAAEEKTITSITAKAKSGEPIMAGTPLTLDMFTVTAYYSDGTSAELAPVTVTSPNWPENYPDNMEPSKYNWSATIPGAKGVYVTFDPSSITESKCDYIYLYKTNNTYIGRLTDTEMAGKSYFIPGDYARIAMKSDSSVSRKGFSATITAAMEISRKRVPTTSGSFEVSLTLLDETENPTEISTTVEMTSEGADSHGICGDDAQWNYEEGTLTITGSGATYDYTDKIAPWAGWDIQKLVVEEGISSIGAGSFVDREELRSVTIPADVSVGSKVFSGCTEIVELNVTSTTAQTMKTRPANIVKECTGDLKVTLAKGVKLPYSSFSYCQSLRSIEIDGDIETIYSSTFSNCSNLVRVVLPNSVTGIDGYVFAGCTNLQEVNLPAGVRYVGSGVFSNCSSLKTIVLPDGIEVIPDSAFLGCSNLESVVLPEKITSINDHAFYGCFSLKNIAIPDHVRTIGNNAFYNCTSLQTVTLGQQSELYSIGNTAFKWCKSLTEINLPDTVKTINSSAFYGSALKELTIPQNVETVGDGFVGSCQNLTELKWNAKRAVWKETSDRYKNMSLTITVGTTVEALPATTMKSLVTCGAEAIRFEGENWLSIAAAEQAYTMLPLGSLPSGRYYVNKQEILYRLEDDRAVLAYVPAGIKSCTIPEAVPVDEGRTSTLPVTAVGNDALHLATDLESMTFDNPGRIAELADCAFAYAENLSSINGSNTASAVLDQFTDDCQKGQLLFVGTKIGNDTAPITDELQFSGIPDSRGNDTLVVTVRTTKSTNYTPSEEADGTKVYYTGEAAITVLNISNPASAALEKDDGAVVRLYMDFDNAGGKPTINEGEYNIEIDHGRTYKYKVTKIPGINRYCFEIQRPLNGDTISLNLESGYPSPKTGGGTNRIFGAILSKADAEKLKDNELPYTDQYQNLQWKTEADDFPVTKERVNQTVSAAGDGAGHAYITGLAYNITTSRAGNTLEGIGKDLMTAVDYTDVLTLPEGITLSDDALQAIKTGSYHWDSYGSTTCIAYTANYKEILRASVQNNTSYTIAMYSNDCSLAVNDAGQLIIRWTLRNSTVNQSTPLEMTNTTLRLTFGSKTLYMAHPVADTDYQIDNTVSATEHFSYSEDKFQEDKCSYTFTSGKGSLRIEKVEKTGSSQMGGKRQYAITASNPAALPYEELAYLEDSMPSTEYLSADDIVALFSNDQAKQASVSIYNATICDVPTKTTVRDMSGEIAGEVSVGNTNTNVAAGKYNGMNKGRDPSEKTYNAEIAISWCEDEGQTDRLLFELSDPYNRIEEKSTSCALDAEKIQELLDSWGYLVTNNVRFRVVWDLRGPDGTFTLLGGQKVSYDLQVTNKDTFMQLTTDQKYHTSDSGYFYNYVYGENSARRTLATHSCGGYNKHEFSLVKGATIDGQDVIENSDLLKNGAIVDYVLTVDHKSDAHYDILPLTDHLSSAQVLLAEVEQNQNAEWAQGLKIVTDADGTGYYKLETEKIYKGVWLNGNYADSVQVTGSGAGRDTLIKWYFSNYGGTRTDNIHYKAILEMSGQDNGVYYFHNETWLGDHETHRLYNELGWKRLDYTFDKKIVNSVGDTSEGTDYCQIKSGQTVIYRLKLQTIQQGTYTLTGINLSDALPKSLGKVGGFQWRKGNGFDPGTVDIVEYDYESPCAVPSPDKWSITTDNYDKSRQYIKWEDEFTVTISEKPLYIYVRLTYPKDAEWQEYAKQYGAEVLENTFYVEGIASTVTHELQLPSKAYLQKGVWKTFSTASAREWSASLYASDLVDSPNSLGRWYYSNDDMMTRFVCYYVTVRNDGLSRLYLNDLQDTLPQGFTLEAMTSGDPENYYGKRPTEYITTSSSSDFVPNKKEDGTRINYRNAQVDVSIETDEATNVQKLTFHLSERLNYSNAVHYDAQRDKYYLNPNEAIQFGYYCRTNASADTTKEATNTIVMPYYDYTGGGLACDGEQLTALKNDTYTPNDGDCKIWDNSMAGAHGFTPNNNDLIAGDKNSTQWLKSDVTVYRGGIIPGITKSLAAKISQNNIVTESPLAAAPVDTLRWKVTAQNNGTLPMIDFTLSDTMPSPYYFTGKVDYRVEYQGTNQELITGSVNNGLFTLRETSDKNVFEIVTNTNNRDDITELRVNGAPQRINVNWIVYGKSTTGSKFSATTIEVGMTQDTATKATTLWVHFSDPRMSLPEGGVATLTLDTKQDAASSWRNTVYTNSCNITPMVQPWDTNAVNQGNATKQTPPFGDKQEHDSVRNSAPVTVAFGYTTSSQKSVEQVGNSDNKATSDDTENYIVLPDAGTKFRYNLEVRNADPTNVSQMQSMDELILIDSLPEPGDHTVFQPDDWRDSKFKVSLAEDCHPVVTITDKEGNVTKLTDDQYTLEYSTNTTFTSDDWDGTSEWSDSPTGARSLRLKLKDTGDENNPLMPSGCTVRLSFTCMVDDQAAAAGQIAWNSFGYHYKMHGASSPQEAAPLKVGVMLPTRPTLQKKLQRNGAPYAAEQDETFTFYCYTDQPLTNLPDNWTADDLKAALAADNRKYKEITLTVNEGKTESEVLMLAPDDDWQWTEGKTYTLVEAPTGNYALATLGGLPQSSYTFTYDPAKTTTIVAVNNRVTWNFTIEKVDADAQTTRLADAWFALYSPDERDAMTDDAYDALTYKPAKTVEDGGRTWYLTQAGVTKAENGFLTFSDLLRKEYRYKEFRAPNGYTLDDTLYTVERTADSTQFRTVTNKSGYVLPKTGGCGTTPFTAAGLLLTAAAVCLLYRQYKRRRGKATRTE